MRLLFDDGDGLAMARARCSPTPDADELAALTNQATPADEPAVGASGEEEDLVTIWRPLWPRFDLFRRCLRVWRYPAMGGPPLGLDWGQVRAIADALEVAWNAETLDLMQAMESATAAVWTEEWKRAHPPKKGS